MRSVSRLAELRTARGWTQEQLSAKAHISLRAIQYLEREDRVPRLLLQQSLARALKVSVAELGFDEGTPLVT
jgi:transcriptional regulator with XRE-family HTH domain